MCFPVYQKLNGTYELVAIYTDFKQLMDEWDTKFGAEFIWEPWPINETFKKAMGLEF